MTVAVAAELAEWAVALRPADIPEDVRHAAQRHLLDAIGVAAAARRTADADPALTVARELGGPAEARIPGDHRPIGAPAAAFGTGALIHALDFDDTHAGGLVHVSAVVVAAALAVGQQVGATGARVLTSLVVGAEIMCRLGAASPHGFHTRGLHATSVCGPFAAAAVASHLLDASAARTVDALGIAGSSAGGLLEFLHTGSSTKQLHPGTAASAGIVAARLAAAGASGPASVLEGEYGVYATMSGRPADVGSILDGLGERWECTRITIKPYPDCQLIHATLDALATLDVRSSDVADVADVADVLIDVHPDAIDIVCEPRAGKLRPRSPYEAKFSLPWTVAARLIDGRIGVDTYTSASTSRADVADLAARVRVNPSPAEGHAADAPGRVIISTTDGRVLHASVDASSGTPDRPLDDDALVAKFIQNVGDEHRARSLATLILDLDSLSTLEPLLDLAAGVRP